MLRRTQTLSRRPASGVSIVELLVGVTIALIVVGGGLLLLANFTSENRRLLLETRLNQDLRAAMDVVTRDLRRAGYWQGATAGMWVASGPNVPAQNAYRAFYASACNASPLGASAPAPAGAASSVCYSISADSDNAVASAEYYGFHLSGGVLFAVVAGSAQQPLTDSGTLTVTDFVVTPSSQIVPMAGFCKVTCTSNCPRVVVREFEVVIKGRAPTDATVERQLRSNVRVRNDYYDGQCPSS
jgi:prepilin peptidase dependent protein B